MVPDLFSFLMILHLEKVDEVLSPGLTVLRWTSLDIDSYVRSGHEILERTKLLISRVNDIYDLRIDQECKNVGATPLCELPDQEPWSMAEFKSRISVSTVYRINCSDVHIVALNLLPRLLQGCYDIVTTTCTL